MISAKLIKSLEEKGFKLDFPSYHSKEREIIEILLEGNDRLNLAIPLLLEEKFDYKKIITELASSEIKKTYTKNRILSSLLICNFKKIIIITNRIFEIEKIDNQHLKKIIKENKLKYKYAENEFLYYYDAFKDFLKEKTKYKDENLKEQIDIRSKLNLNKAISNIYSPGKQRIMKKIFNHEPLTNTELKYYYRSIRPLIKSILNENLQKYIQIIESTKKYSE